MPRSLSGAAVAVIGAGGGLGAAITRELAGRGAQLLLAGPHVDRIDGSAVDSSSVVELDLRDPRAGDVLAAAATERHGRLDGLVNAAGVVAFGPLTETDDTVIEELFLTNVLGPLWLIKRAVPLLAASRGFVVNLSAVVAERPMLNMAAYSATKAALTAADRALTRELRPLGIQVCDVRPPHTDTGLAGRPLGGTAPRLPVGLAPELVASRIVAAVEAGSAELPSDAFATGVGGPVAGGS